MCFHKLLCVLYYSIILIRLVLVFQTLGPDVAIKQARGVRHQVVPLVSDSNIKEQSLDILVPFIWQPSKFSFYPLVLTLGWPCSVRD